jgi:hypothetical protein
MGLTEHVTAGVETLSPTDVVRFDDQSPWVTVIRVKADRMGYDMLYAPFGGEPRWRGFDDGDTVTLKRARG